MTKPLVFNYRHYDSLRELANDQALSKPTARDHKHIWENISASGGRAVKVEREQMTISYRVISRRCDEPMRRSKEKCHKPNGKRWKCTGDCRTCICCLETIEDGTERHFPYRGRHV